MFMDIFSNFDPMWFNLCYKSFFLIALIMMIAMSMFWLIYGGHKAICVSVALFIYIQMISSKLKHMKMSISIMLCTFIIIIFMNIMGMVPYAPSITSHILFTISISLPLWMLLIASSFCFSAKQFIAHFLPDSAPMWLAPFLTMVELISILMRPMTLSFRLAANMTAGHVIMNLVLLLSVSKNFQISLCVLLISSMYIMFEIIICIIQAYIFCLLLSLYANEHS